MPESYFIPDFFEDLFCNRGRFGCTKGVPMSKKKSENEPKEKKSAAKKAISKVKKAIEPTVLPPVVVDEKPKKRSVPDKKSGPAKSSAAITTEDIGLRAYYIAERRLKMGWPGDHTSDWVEAERQLVVEIQKRK
jgi:hypothetical protein